MSYSDWFRDGWGQRRGQHEERIYISATDPQQLDTPERVASDDSDAARRIAELEQAVEDLKAYRRDLAARYAYLETAPYSRRLEIERCPSWRGGITYTVRIVRTYEDGTTVEELREEYAGKERRDALKRFDALRKQYPGIEIRRDLERRAWEK